MKFTSLVLFFSALSIAAFAQPEKTYHVKSPDGKIDLTVNVGKTVNWSVKHEETDVIIPSTISVSLDKGEVLGKNAIIKSAKTVTANEIIKTPFYKKAEVKDNYTQLLLTFKGDYGLAFRAYNDGVAYRFVIVRKGTITVKNEEANFNFKDDDKA